ncbi:hypothetical protein JOC34_000812 [Virgibacillus halotolerans]|uniref:hypothetical protein n=1 Tax=Virgibacillus halotolerans TaxID=1071053 RepID=UPI001961DB28|nr:hypothetical protein [Virgibacillus halotolerans]MBM7598455.1 hypothetical protein [Virgibacillus halotolerans]
MKKVLIVMALLLVIVLAGCGGKRDISSPETAIIGHWINEHDNAEDEDTHFYITKEKFIMVDQGTKSVSDYEVSASNDEEKWIEIKTEGRNDVGSLVRRLEFTNDEMTEINNPLTLDDVLFSSERADSKETQDLLDAAKEIMGDTEIESTWSYVDDLTEPEK